MLRFSFAIFALLPLHALADNSQSFPLEETKGLIERNVKLESVEYKGRKALRITIPPPQYNGIALLPDTDFQDGAIEADLALKVNAPPGVRMPGFIGIAFRVRPDVTHYEMFYIRPGNSQADDQAMRNHSVQYVSEPDFGWYALRRAWPGVYETWTGLEPGAWTHLKIEVAGRNAKLYLNGAKAPVLVVNGLKGEDLRGAVGLWGFANEESYFSNVRIISTSPEAVTNGSDASGTWDVKSDTDAGRFAGSLKLTRDGTSISGMWTGDLGENRLVSGTWRNGYVELTFQGNWPKSPLGSAGTVTVQFAGWIDGASAKGRMKVEGRADGQWTAARKP